MLLPIRTSIIPRRTPYANYALIVLNIVFFMLTYGPHTIRLSPNHAISEPLHLWAKQFMLQPANPYIWQFVSYAFLHGGLMHIFGNMYFLYLFGNNVNDKLGNIGYVCLYLAGAVFAGIGHIAMGHVNPVLGASGAVAAITGAYMVLFPRTLITVVYWLFFIGTVEISALYFIIFKLIFWDNIFEPLVSPPQAIAYGAHLAGYAFGIAASLLLIVFGFISHSQTDLWFMIRQWNRRRQYRETVSDGHDPFSGRSGRRRIKVKVTESPQEQARQDEIATLRSEIIAFVNQRNIPAAADKYVQLVGVEPETVLPPQCQLDIANQLMSSSRWEMSARAYQAFMDHYPSDKHAEQVCLMLGLIYCRYLNKSESAIKYLKMALDRLTDPGQIRMCRQELDGLEN